MNRHTFLAMTGASIGLNYDGSATASSKCCSTSVPYFNHLASDVVDRVSKLKNRATHLQQFSLDRLMELHHSINERGEDVPEA